MERLGRLGTFARVIAVAAALVIATRGTATAQTDPQSLTIRVAVCREGYEGDDLAAECGDRVARAYDVGVSASDADTPIADGVAPGDDGQAVVDLTDRTPSVLTVVINTAVNVGSRAVICTAGGAPLDAEFAGTAAAIPVVRLDADTATDIACTVYLYGFPNDGKVLDVAATAGDTAMADGGTTAVDGSDGSRESVNEAGVVVLPSTGSGPTRGNGLGAAVPLASLLVVLTAGAVGLRRHGAPTG